MHLTIRSSKLIFDSKITPNTIVDLTLLRYNLERYFGCLPPFLQLACNIVSVEVRFQYKIAKIFIFRAMRFVQTAGRVR